MPFLLELPRKLNQLSDVNNRNNIKDSNFRGINWNNASKSMNWINKI